MSTILPTAIKPLSQQNSQQSFIYLWVYLLCSKDCTEPQGCIWGLIDRPALTGLYTQIRKTQRANNYLSDEYNKVFIR